MSLYCEWTQAFVGATWACKAIRQFEFGCVLPGRMDPCRSEAAIQPDGQFIRAMPMFCFRFQRIDSSQLKLVEEKV